MISRSTLAICLVLLPSGVASAQTPQANIKGWTFKKNAQPFLRNRCYSCHGPKKQESGIRVDRIDGKFSDKSIKFWQVIVKNIESGNMPPEKAPQPAAQERQKFTQWVRFKIKEARSRPRPKNGSIRRLTVAQYRNTIRDLLGIHEDLTGVLPADGVSKEGFTNNTQTLLLSPLLLEAYVAIAEKALDMCIVDERKKPVIQTFRMDLGESINKKPYPKRLILGANSHLLRNQDFVVTELAPKKPFAFTPFAMQRKFRFIEGYRGNDTVRGWREFDSIYHAVFACMRGTPNYPHGAAYQVIPPGLVLRPAIPSAEIFGRSSTYGPKANFKVSLRELPERGHFQVRVQAARYDDGILLRGNDVAKPQADQMTVPISQADKVKIKKAGVYQLDVNALAGKRHSLKLQLGDRHFFGTLLKRNVKPRPRKRSKKKNKKQPTQGKKTPGKKPVAEATSFLMVRLPAGDLPTRIEYSDRKQLQSLTFTPVTPGSQPYKRFVAFEQRNPLVGVYIGLRRDCGSTMARVGASQMVRGNQLKTYTFFGAINNFPSPDVEKNNVNYLAGVRDIGVRSDYTDGREMPRLLIRSVEFEGPYYKTWPPQTHRRIFIDSPDRNNPELYAMHIISKFAGRAFRRAPKEQEIKRLFAVWKQSYNADNNFQQAIKDTLLVVLTSPQFLFLIEKSSSPSDEPLRDDELASKLSYFLWNAAPDKQLNQLASRGQLRKSLDKEIDRLIDAPQFRQFTREFTSQWLRLDKFDVVNIDAKRYPKLTRDTKVELRKEPIRTLEYLIRNNLSIKNLVQSDFIVANEVVASYYGLGDRVQSGLDFVAIKHNSANLGGILTQASILSALSDGREANPVKRGAWVARKIIAEPPEDPPPNVPAIMEDKGLTLRQKLERHRNQKGCANCHKGIDPWGLPFQRFDAGGLFHKKGKIDASSILPDKTKVRGLNELKRYLATKRLDRVAFSFLKHLTTYAVGRTLTYNEIAFLEEHGIKLRSTGYRARDMVRFVIHSKIFLTK